MKTKTILVTGAAGFIGFYLCKRLTELGHFVDKIEAITGIQTQRTMQPPQAGDVHQTWANVEHLKTDYGYQLSTSLKKGVNAFVKWYKAYYI